MIAGMATYEWTTFSYNNGSKLDFSCGLLKSRQSSDGWSSVQDLSVLCDAVGSFLCDAGKYALGFGIVSVMAAAVALVGSFLRWCGGRSWKTFLILLVGYSLSIFLGVIGTIYYFKNANKELNGFPKRSQGYSTALYILGYCAWAASLVVECLVFFCWTRSADGTAYLTSEVAGQSSELSKGQAKLKKDFSA